MDTETIVAMPQLNATAPDFTAPTTAGVKSLKDYQGKWLVLFSHPADFTPVCTTEFIAFAIDSTHSHIAWSRNIKEKFGVDIPFPIIADLKMEVAKAYGMIHPGAGDTSSVRATFIIDPESKLRAMVYYPMSNGRSIPEFLRLLTALQTSDANGVATPEGWQPGDKVIVPPAATLEEANQRMESGDYECTDFYFCKKSL